MLFLLILIKCLRYKHKNYLFLDFIIYYLTELIWYSVGVSLFTS